MPRNSHQQKLFTERPAGERGEAEGEEEGEGGGGGVKYNKKTMSL